MREADSMQDSPWPGGADFSAPAVLGIAAKVWGVGALCRAIADALDARFNPVTVRGEITGFSRAASGHCYFSLKDASGQIRCAMFRRAATLLSFSPRDGALVEVRGKLGVYEQRGDLQLIVESMQPAGQGALFEQFLRLKAQLESEGLFDPARLGRGLWEDDDRRRARQVRRITSIQRQFRRGLPNMLTSNGRSQFVDETMRQRHIYTVAAALVGPIFVGRSATAPRIRRRRSVRLDDCGCDPRRCRCRRPVRFHPSEPIQAGPDRRLCR